MVACPGCGALFDALGLPPDARGNASGECLQAYHALSLRTLALGDAEFVHQHAVDTYAAQHAGSRSRPIGVYFALAGLYLALERSHTGCEVQRAHMAMARGDKRWPTFDPPRAPAQTTILEGQKELRRWMADVWASWSHEQSRVRNLVDLALIA